LTHSVETSIDIAVLKREVIMNLRFLSLLLAISILSAAPFAIAGTKNIKGVNRAELVQALYETANFKGLGWLASAWIDPELSLEEAQQQVGKRLEYFKGKVMKIKVPSEKESDELDTWLYNRENWEGAAERVVDELRIKNCSNKLMKLWHKIRLNF
jgi:hypothetical protein